jgi:hypothetical protein
MDQKELCDSVAKQLDAVAETVYWGLLLAVIFLWAGLTKQDPIKALGMEVGRSYALFVACTFYFIANFFAMIQILRIGDILLRVDKTSLPIALTKLWTHKWAANPFAFFGRSVIATAQGSLGYGLLIVIWWIGNASLYCLVDGSPRSGVTVTLAGGLFAAIGLLSMVAIQRVLKIVSSRLSHASGTVGEEFRSTMPVRNIGAFAGISIGGAIFLAVTGLDIFILI